jgi:prepilin-type N-terminal cleavage/methylation domain-containing protein
VFYYGLARWLLIIKAVRIKFLTNKEGDSKMKTMKQGFTLVEIMIVVAIIGLLAAIAIPSFMKARTQSQTNACINNLRMIEAGKEQWALATKKAQDYAIATADEAEVLAYVKNPSSATNCPAGGTIAFGAIGSNATCTITNHVLL